MEDVQTLDVVKEYLMENTAPMIPVVSMSVVVENTSSVNVDKASNANANLTRNVSSLNIKFAPNWSNRLLS